MRNVWQDLRYGARMLLKRPGFTLIAVITLALGIGVNTAIFSVVNAVLLQPLPYDQPERLVALYDALPTLGYPREGLSEAEFVRLRQENRSFAELAAWYWVPATLRGVSEPEKEGGRSAAANSRSRLRRSLVVLETALAVVLLVAAGLLIRSVMELQRAEKGFRPDRLLTMRLTPPDSAYPDNQRVTSLYERLIARINALPGVESAAVTDPLPPNDGNNHTVIEIEGRQFDMNRQTHMSVDFRTVSVGYFQTMGMRLTRGRLFTDADQEGAPPVAVVNETFARNHWPGEDPVGKRFRYLNAPPDSATTRYLTIVGVVADAKNRGIADAAWQEAFIPLAQHAATYGGGRGLQQAFNLVVRTMADPLTLTTAAQREVRDIKRDFIISQVKTMDEILAAAVTQPRFNMILLGGFALLALGLGAVGIYGVIAYTVAQRTHEIGVRMALGAQSRDVLKLVVAEGMALAVSGVGIGLLASFALTRLMKTLLFGVGATDPLTFGSIALLLTGVALLACYIPARRAMKVDPMIALRCE